MTKYALGLWMAGLALGCSGGPEPTDVQGASAGSTEVASVAPTAPPAGVLARECFRYDSYLAALGELTAQCTGTVDPRLYHVGDDGLLAPTFQSCVLDPSRMRKIKQLLSLQLRGERAPFAKECLAERFATAQAELAESGITSCPAWKKSHVINPIGHATISRVERALVEHREQDDEAPRLRATEGITRAELTSLEAHAALVDAAPLTVFDLLEENSQYAVAGQTAERGCESPAACAASCAKAFSGFVIGTKGAENVVTDPIAWLTDTVYGSAPEDPYLRETYYHPMSYYGGVPGVVFGDPNRAEPCGPNTTCLAELCSYYAGSHIKTRMQMDCVIPGDDDTCAAYCGPPLPKP